jgi:hypothetical protein
LNHKSGSISGIAAVYSRHDYAKEKRAALARWSARVEKLVEGRDKSSKWHTDASGSNVLVP